MLIAYIYDQTDTVVEQLFKISNFECRKVMSDIGTASFDVDPTETGVQYSYLKEFTRIRIAMNDSGTEKTVFDGVVRETSATLSGIKVTLNDFLYLLKKKKSYYDKSYSGVAINSILSEILGEINARYASGITLSCSVATTVTKTYKDYISFFDLLKDLAEGGYEFVISGKVITFATTVGLDLSVDPNLVEFRADVAVPNEINITDYEIKRDSENFCNAVTANASAGAATATDSTSITAYGRIEEVYSVDGDATAAAASNLANRKDSVSEVSVTPIANNFFIADIGDKVKVYVDGGNDLQFYNGTLRVIEKSLTYAGADTTVELKLSVNKISTPTLLDGIKNLRDRVKKLEV